MKISLSYEKRLHRYEEEKALLRERGLSPEEYEAAIRELMEAWKI